MTPQRSAGVALILLFLVAHLFYLPRTLEDLDSINFALGVRQFDVSRHQPHPPGYPVYIALSKASTLVLRAAGVDAASSRGLAIWSAIGAAAALPALFLFFRRLEGRESLSWWATVLIALSPLFWFTALRPLSDMLGFAVSMWVLALVAGNASGRPLVIGSLLAGLAVGIRTQTAVLTFPFLLYALARRRNAGEVARAVGAVAVGGLAWAVPMFIASGGLSAYLAALSFQADADLSGSIVNLWSHHSIRDIVNAAMNTFVWPWDWWPGLAVCVLAFAGLLRLTWRSWPVTMTLAIAFVPYVIFHLLFHETVTTRYALPLLPLIAYAALAALEGLPGRAMQGAAIGLSLISLIATLPAARHYGREGAPVFRAFDEMAATAHGGGGRVDTIGFHASFRRAIEWSEQILPAATAKAPHGREWLSLVTLWRARPDATVWFAADPKRTDLALFDGRVRELARAYRWGFPEPPYVGGARPGNMDWYTMQPPAWMLDRGWSITAETGGVTARDRFGPHLAPTVAWLRRQAGPVTLMIGGRNLGPPSRLLEISLNGAPLPPVILPANYFLTRIDLPAGALTGAAHYQPLELRTSGSEQLLLEQFDSQPEGVPMLGLDAGWQEPEFNPATGLAWRWMSERADLWVRPVGRAVTLRIEGESPLRYFDAAPKVRVLAGDREIASFELSADFDQSIAVPADALAHANGRLRIESSRFFVPAERDGGADRRRLALRIFKVHVE